MKTKNKESVAKIATLHDLENGPEVKKGTILDVQWLDACAHTNVEKINSKNLLELLCPTNTIGKLIAVDHQVLCLATNISAANGLDLLAIPVRWIESIKIIGG